MAKKPKTEIITVSKELQASLDILSAVKKEADKIGNNCLLIKVVDETTLAVAQQNLSSANQIVKSVEDKRKTIKEPYLQSCKTIDETCKKLVETIEKGMAHIKAEVKMWDDNKREKDRKAQEELLNKQEEANKAVVEQEVKDTAIRDYFMKCVDSMYQMYNSAHTALLCRERIQYIKTKFPTADKFGSYGSESARISNLFCQALEHRSYKLNAQDVAIANMQAQCEFDAVNAIKLTLDTFKLSLTDKAEKIQELQRVQEQELAVLQTSQASNKTRGVKMVWKFELVDKSKLSQGWIQLDDSKAKEYLSENKEFLTDGEIVNGVKFYKGSVISA